MHNTCVCIAVRIHQFQITFKMMKINHLADEKRSTHSRYLRLYVHRSVYQNISADGQDWFIFLCVCMMFSYMHSTPVCVNVQTTIYLKRMNEMSENWCDYGFNVSQHKSIVVFNVWRSSNWQNVHFQFIVVVFLSFVFSASVFLLQRFQIAFQWCLSSVLIVYIQYLWGVIQFDDRN